MQAAILKSGRTAPYSKPVHTSKTYTAAQAAAGRMRLSAVSAVYGVAKSTIQIWTVQDRSPEAVTNCPRVQITTRGRCAVLAARPPARRLPERRRDAKPWLIRKNPQA